MTATLVAQNLAGGYGHRILFEGLDLTVAPGAVSYTHLTLPTKA